MPFDPRSPPEGLDPLLDWLERFGRSLVRLAPSPLADLRGAVTRADRELRAHLDAGSRSPGPSGDPTARTLAAEHDRFVTSLEQLWWHLSIVENDDHGGHRQALGQYLLVFVEALRRHRSDELAADGRPRARGPPAPTPSAPSKAN